MKRGNRSFLHTGNAVGGLRAIYHHGPLQPRLDWWLCQGIRYYVPYLFSRGVRILTLVVISQVLNTDGYTRHFLHPLTLVLHGFNLLPRSSVGLID